MKYLFIPLLACIAACNLGGKDSKPSTLTIRVDTTSPVLPSGYYKIVDSLTPGAVKRQIFTMDNDRFAEGQIYYITKDQMVSFRHLALINIDEDGKRPSLKMAFDEWGTQKLAELSKGYYGTQQFESYPKIGMVINNTLVQVAVITSNIDNGWMVLNGAYSFNDYVKIKEWITLSKK